MTMTRIISLCDMFHVKETDQIQRSGGDGRDASAETATVRVGADVIAEDGR